MEDQARPESFNPSELTDEELDRRIMQLMREKYRAELQLQGLKREVELRVRESLG